jgi:hypothetical protein
MKLIRQILLVLIMIGVGGIPASAQQALQVDVAQITKASEAILQGQANVTLSMMKQHIDMALAILTEPADPSWTDAERALQLEFRRELAQAMLASFQMGLTSQIELSQLVDAFLRQGNRIEIALRVTQPSTDLTFSLGSDRERRERAESYVRIVTNTAFGNADLIARLIDLIETSQEQAIPILQNLSNLLGAALSS